ncbi:MAG: O-antigen ligase family protein [Phormidesmis sp.]
MGLIESAIESTNRQGPISRQDKAWLVSLIALPYVSYAALLVMLGLLISAMAQRGQQIWRLCGQRGFGWLAAGLLLSSSFALNRGESFLQLVHFLPFFLIFGAMATVPGVVQRPFAQLESLARWLLLTSVPMSLLAVIEYAIKFEAIAPRVQSMPLPSGLLTFIYEPDFGHRAHSLFSHPNALSAYLAIIFGLGLGLVLKSLGDQKLWRYSQLQGWLKGWSQVGALGLCAIAIFCTGSRNGVIIALVLVAITLYTARRHRWVMLAGLAGSGAIIAAVLSLGIGGRSLSIVMWTQDPRVSIWRLAIEMIHQRPWLGWGFAGLRLLYEPGSIPDYDIVFHAHNIWLFLASEAGIPVMVGFCIVVGTIYYRGVRAFINWNSNDLVNQRQGDLMNQRQGDRSILLGYLLAFASCLLFSLFDVILFDARINVFSYGLLASIYCLSQACKSADG